MKKIINIFAIISVCLYFLLVQMSAFSIEVPAISELKSAKTQLQLERSQLKYAQISVDKLKALQLNIESAPSAEQLLLSAANSRSSIDGAKIAIADANEAISILQNKLDNVSRLITTETISRLKRASENKHDASEVAVNLQQAHAMTSVLVKLQQDRLEVLKNLLSVDGDKLATEQKLLLAVNNLDRLKSNQQETDRISAAIIAEEQHQQSLLQHLSDNTKLLAAMPNDPIVNSAINQDQRSQLSYQSMMDEEAISVSRVNILLYRMQSQSTALAVANVPHKTISDLDKRLTKITSLSKEVSGISKVVQDKLQFIKLQQALLTKHGLNKLDRPTDASQRLVSLRAQYQNQVNVIAALVGQLNGYKDSIQKALKFELSVRQTLPGLNAAAWMQLFNEVMIVPVLLYKALESSVMQVWNNLNHSSSGTILLFCLAFLSWVLSSVVLRVYLSKFIEHITEKPKIFSRNFILVIIKLVKSNTSAICLLGILTVSNMVTSIDLTLWTSLSLVYICCKLASNLTYLLLVDSETEALGQDVKLYKGLRWVFVSGGLLTALAIMAHQLPVAFEAKILFNRAFMLLLFVVSMLLIRAWKVLPSLLLQLFSAKRIYVIQAIRLVSMLLPITLLSNAIVGLIGYVELAWTIGKIQALALCIMASYMIVRGLLIDFMEYNYDLLIRHMQAGWLWGQAFLKPIDRLLRMALFIGAVLLLIYSLGLNQNQTFLSHSNTLLNKKLFELGSNIITPMVLIKLTVVLSFLYWLARWTREFAFRWLYAKARDVGVRNSLAVFTQYIVVVLGVLFSLKSVGFELKGFAVVAAAFAAGVGFGLRDLANNFVSGMMLLVERPFRTGDTIALGGYEGEVINTGMRSLKMRTWDHMEVIVPNSDMYSKPFVNWTHQDSIVRTVVNIKVNRMDNPHLIQKIILDVLENLESVVEDPAPEVFMKDMDETLLLLEVRYFTNLQVQTSRPRVRSEVLFSIWDKFSEFGIRSPNPQYDVHVQSKAMRLNDSGTEARA